MKLDDALAIVERFFLDVIGTVFAGALFLFLVVYLFALPFRSDILSAVNAGVGLPLFLGVSYAVGHALTHIGNYFVEPIFRMSLGGIYIASEWGSGLRASDWNDYALRPIRGLLSLFQKALWWTNKKKIEEGMSLQGAAAVSLEAVLRTEGYLPGPKELKSFNELRNLALSVEGVDKPLAYRFQFLGLFNLTTASAVVLSVFCWSVFHLAQVWFPSGIAAFTAPYALTPRPFSWIYIPSAALFAAALFERSARFHGMSMRLPISDALLRIKRERAAPLALDSQTEFTQGMARVYLAGGFRSGWQDKVRAHFAGRLDFIDPRAHGLASNKNYTAWDLRGVEKAQLVFAYLERNNPGGYALALEVGYAKALGKIVIFADESGDAEDERKRHVEMVRTASTYTCESLDEAIALLESILAQKLT